MKKNYKLAVLMGLVGIGVLLLSACTIVISGYAYVTYKANGASEGTPPVDATLYTVGDPVTIMDNTRNLVKTGSVFVGWNTNPDGSGTWYYPNSTMYISSYRVILYAQWMPWNAIPGTWDLTYKWDTMPSPLTSHWHIQGSKADQSDWTFYDDQGGHGLWDISANTIQLFYSNGTSYVFPYPYEGTNYLGNARGLDFMFGTMAAPPRGSYQPQGDWYAERDTTGVYSQGARSVLELGSITPSGEVVK